MWAWTFTARGSPAEVLKLRHDLPQPQSTDLHGDEIIVKISHVSLFAPFTRLMAVIPHTNRDPWIPEFAFSGTITAVGDEQDERRLKRDDVVFGMVIPKTYFKYNGVLAEHVIVPKDHVFAKPDKASAPEASGLAGAGCTVIGLAERGGLLEIEDTKAGPVIKNKGLGKRVLVVGGSTGTGLDMLQLAKYLVGDQGEVVTTASPRNREAVLRAGANTVIDYTKHPKLHILLKEQHSTKPFDLIVDFVGSDDLLYPESPAYLKPDGCFAFAGSMPNTHSDPGNNFVSNIIWVLGMMKQVIGWAAHSNWPTVIGGVPRRSFFHSGKPSLRNMQLVKQLVEEGKLNGIVDSVWPMKDTLKAYEHLLGGKICGKVVVQVSA